MALLINPTDLARETLKMLAARRIAPTPENFARYYHEIAGTPPGGGVDERLARSVREAADANPTVPALARLTRTLDEPDPAQFRALLVALASGREGGVRRDWGALLRGLIRQLDARQTGTSQTRRREGLERMLISFGTDAQLFDKLQGLMQAWGEAVEPAATPIAVSYEVSAGTDGQGAAQGARLPAVSQQAENVKQLKELLALTLELGVADRLERFPELAEEAQRLAQDARQTRGVEPWARYAVALRQLFFRLAVRGEADAELLDALLRLLGLLVNNIGELVEDDQWLAGQVTLMREVINAPLTTQRIEEAERRFKEVVYKQSLLKHSLREAKVTLKTLIGVFVQRLGEMTQSTDAYHGKIESYAGRLRQTEDIAELQRIVDELMGDTRSMQVDMLRTHEEMVDARRHAEDAETKVRRLEAELEQVSGQISQDPLTGALNRRGLDEAMQREMSRADRRDTALCVAVLDLDNFKRLNDTYGHQAGDDALVHLIKVVKKTLRPTDITARFGGEEFVILFSETPLAQAVYAMGRLQRELTKRFFLHNNERLLITFSAGVAQFKSGETQEVVIERADRAMYQAKLQGKNRVVAAETP
jgi:diguanylate cyclase